MAKYTLKIIALSIIFILKWNKIQIEMLQNVQHIANNHWIFH